MAALALVGLDPSPLVMLRSCDFSSLRDGMPKLAVEGMQRFEAFKLSPLDNYHSGRRNDVFYVREDGARLVLEYSSTDRTQKTLDVAWLLNHAFVRPRMLEARAETLSDGFVRLPLSASGYLRLEFTTTGLREGMNDLHIVLDSRKDPLRQTGSDVAQFSRSHLIHANVVLGAYRAPAAGLESFPDASSDVPQNALALDLTVLARARGLAVVNPADEQIPAVIARPTLAPEYILVAPRRAATYRDRIREEGSVVLLLNPHTRLQDRWGRSSDGEDIAYTFRPLLERTPAPISMGTIP